MRAVAVSIDWLESSSTGISYTIYQLHVFYGRMSLRAAYSQEGMCCASKKIHTTVCYTDTTHAQRCSLLKAQRKTCLESVSVILGSNNIVSILSSLCFTMTSFHQWDSFLLCESTELKQIHIHLCSKGQKLKWAQISCFSVSASSSVFRLWLASLQRLTYFLCLSWTDYTWMFVE